MSDLKTFDVCQLDKNHAELESELQICLKQIEESESKLSLLESPPDVNTNTLSATPNDKQLKDAAYLKDKILLLRQKEVELRRERFQLNQIKMGLVEKFEGKCES